MTANNYTAFVTTGIQGLRHETLPMRLYHKAKKLGVWDPRDIDFSQDRQQWLKLNAKERDALLRITAFFQAGEECVTLELLPLMLVVAQEGRLEEEMFLTTFLWEEAKHTEFFRRFLDEVIQEEQDLHHLHGPSYRKIFYEELPQTMQALLYDHSPAAQIRASITYNMIVEGVLAETGYQGYLDALERQNNMPGLRQGIGYIKRDEARHIAYGIFLISRLLAQEPELWEVAEARLNELFPITLGIVQELEIYSEGEEAPFGLNFASYIAFARLQFTRRVTRIEKARHQSLEYLYKLPENEDAVEEKEAKLSNSS